MQTYALLGIWYECVLCATQMLGLLGCLGVMDGFMLCAV